MYSNLVRNVFYLMLILKKKEIIMKENKKISLDSFTANKI